MTEHQRLQQYYDFSRDTLDTVAEVAEQHRSFESWADGYQALTATPLRKVTGQTVDSDTGFETEVIDIVPHEIEDTLFYHLPMGNSVDTNMLTRLHVLSDVLPHTRIIASNNPGPVGYKSGRLPARVQKTVSQGNFRPTVDPILLYGATLSDKRVEKANQVGFSYGADKAIAGAQHSSKYNIESSEVVSMEPASVKRRRTVFGLAGLAIAFGSSAKHLDDYVSSAEYPAYEDAREVAEKLAGGMSGYAIGLLRASNIAISNGIKQGLLSDCLDVLMNTHPETGITIAWGSESELALDSLMLEMQARHMQDDREKISYMRVDGGHHAMGDDVFLHAALVHQSLTMKVITGARVKG